MNFVFFLWLSDFWSVELLTKIGIHAVKVPQNLCLISRVKLFPRYFVSLVFLLLIECIFHPLCFLWFLDFTFLRKYPVPGDVNYFTFSERISRARGHELFHVFLPRVMNYFLDDEYLLLMNIHPKWPPLPFINGRGVILVLNSGNRVEDVTFCGLLQQICPSAV